MVPQTVGHTYAIGKIAQIQCIKGDSLKEIDIQGNCFLMLIIYEGSAVFQLDDSTFEAVGPCFVCFDERKQPKLVKKRKLKCDAIYFHPKFLNMSMTFELVHGGDYEQVAMNHDMFLLRPFTDPERFVFPIFEEYTDNLKGLLSRLESELIEQQDWYWSCRSRSFFMELIFMLERSYGIIGKTHLQTPAKKIRNLNLKKAVLFIESRYGENITLDGISKAVSVSHSTLTSLFKSEFGITSIEYLWQYRIQVAKKQLEFTFLPIKDISVRCGFKTVQHFCRKFEAYTNTTPTEYRNSTLVGLKKLDAAVAARKK